jgi:hypothetical protein
VERQGQGKGQGSKGSLHKGPDTLASMIEHPLEKVDAYSLSYSISSVILWADKRIHISETIDSVIEHKVDDYSQEKYAFIFIMNCISDPGSKS